MKNVGAVVLVYLVAFAASAFCAGGPARGLKALPECFRGDIKTRNLKCPSNTVKCTVGGIKPGKKVKASCSGRIEAYVKFESDKQAVKFYGASGKGLYQIKAWIQGGHDYCVFKYSPYDTPGDCGNKQKQKQCGFSYAILCAPMPHMPPLPLSPPPPPSPPPPTSSPPPPSLPPPPPPPPPPSPPPPPCDCTNDLIRSVMFKAQPAYQESYTAGSLQPNLNFTVCGVEFSASPSPPYIDCSVSGTTEYTANCNLLGTADMTVKKSYPQDC